MLSTKLLLTSAFGSDGLSMPKIRLLHVTMSSGGVCLGVDAVPSIAKMLLCGGAFLGGLRNCSSICCGGVLTGGLSSW